MSYRFMRLIVFFDLPTQTAADRRSYRAFRKLLIKSGFLMMQESVYSKLIPTPGAEQAVIAALKRGKPLGGCVQVLSVTEKQFSKIEYIVGKSGSDVIDSTERLIIL